jgi:uncharacterized protein YjiS (DUF1127 family)
MSASFVFFRSAFRRRLARRAARKALLAFDDHMLSDIGISRGEIESAVRADPCQPRRLIARRHVF